MRKKITTSAVLFSVGQVAALFAFILLLGV